MEYYNDTEKNKSGDQDRPSGKKKPRKKKKFSRNPLAPVCVILAGSTLASLGVTLHLCMKPGKSEPSPSQDAVRIYTQDTVNNLIEAAREEGEDKGADELRDDIRIKLSDSGQKTSVNDVIRNLYPEYLLYQDGSGYHFVPVEADLPANEIDNSRLTVSANGSITYTSAAGVPAEALIDVSKHQGEIDWEQVYDSGIRYAIIRVGFRGYGSGAVVLDDTFEYNIINALKAGLKVGVYFYTQAVTEEEAVEEAEFVLENIAPYNVTLPVVIDVEHPDDSTARGNQISREERTAVVKAFCERIESAGYEPMIYGNTYTFAAMLDPREISRYDVWYAFYNNYIYYPYAMSIWQYSTEAQVPGINGKVDMNLWFK
ncbi:MAG: glycoside hydrolase family 25 protein [Lachnospiraceae bacterium]|nr:glycoside hydrolase family 25 protein [Lachnospiraceae bacterium]